MFIYKYNYIPCRVLRQTGILYIRKYEYAWPLVVYIYHI